MGALAEAEPLRPAPAPLPAMLVVVRTVSEQALIRFRGNRYSVPPGHTGQIVTVRHQLGTPALDIATARGVGLAHHLRSPDGAGALVRLDEHVAALTRVVLAEFGDTQRAPCPRKHRRPPTAEALAEADRIRCGHTAPIGEQVVVDFDAYASGARPMRGRTPDADAAERGDTRDGRESS